MTPIITINKKDYVDTGLFKPTFIEEYCNLNIYPLVNEIETEAGLLSDLAEALFKVNLPASCNVYGNGNLESIQLLKDNLLNFTKEQSNVTIGYSTGQSSYIKSDYFLLAPENTELDQVFCNKVVIEGLNKVLYCDTEGYSLFLKYFSEYLVGGKWMYSNLVCLCMIVKNAGSLLEQVLTENLPIIDRWCILDTGSTDGTQDVIRRVLANKKGILYEEPFVDFKVSRNRCLELAGLTCKFILMLDDTYSVRGDLRSFLTEVRGDQFSDSFSLMIQSDDTEYYSNRIIKSTTQLRYIHTIHEVITDKNNINVTVPPNKAVIFDHRADYMEKRTNDRKQFDLGLLFKEVEDYPDDPRALYYIAQTYGCIGDELHKAEYFEKRINHPVQGYVQEKIDACFELARCYNFKINPITKQNIINKLTDEEWKICEKLYLQAYSLDTNRPDSLYFIGIHYYLLQDYKSAYIYFLKGFQTGYPVGSQYSLKPTLSFHFLPKFLAEVCYFFDDYTNGFEAAKLFLTSSKFNQPGSESWNLMNNWANIHTQLIKMPPVLNEPRNTIDLGLSDKPIFCIVTDGGWEPWTGSDIETKGLGGSETWIVEMARYISRTGQFHVVVFCKTDGPQFYENVGYNPIQLFGAFIAETVVEHCVISRYTEYVPVAIKGHAKNINIIFHDNLSPEMIIPMSPKIKSLWGLTEWHSKCIKEVFPQFDVKWIHYGITPFESHKIKVKNSFIYSSFPNRGLVVLLRMWPKIIKRFPDATLNIFCNLEHAWTNQVAPDMIREIKTLLKVNKTGIFLHGWVSKTKLGKYWESSEYFLYPCIFEETFCLTAMEAAISKTCVITNGLAALSETAKYGYTIPGNPLSKEWQSECMEKLFKIMETDHFEKVNLNYNFAKSLSWESQALAFLKSI